MKKDHKPNLFVVGEPKCGTTALIDFLGQHPDIFTTKFEVGAFQEDLMASKDRWRGRKKGYHLGRAKKLYKKLFDKVEDEVVIGEATTGNIWSKVAARKIHDFNPSARIIILVRNPVDFLYSLHSQYVVNLDESVKEFRKALELEPRRRKGLDLPRQVPFPEMLYYSEMTQFTEHIKRYLEVFPRKQVKLIVYDDFKRDNAKVYEEVLGFLGVDRSFRPRLSRVNANKFVRCESLKRIIDYLKLPYWASRILPRRFHSWLSTLYHKGMFSTRNRVPLDPDFRKELMKRYKPEVVRLSKLLKRDLVKEWGYDRI